MNKSNFFWKNGLLVQNDKYVLRAMCENDKENYLKLYRENSIVAKAFSKIGDLDYDEFAEFVWEKIPEEDSIYVSIFGKADYTYVGNIVLQHLSSSTPEIGIDVLKEYHRQGIAYDTIPLFTKRVLELKTIEYFLVRIYSDNIASTKLFEKLGALRIGHEPSELGAMLVQMKQKLKDEYEELITRNPDVEDIANENCIVQYRYFPELM